MNALRVFWRGIRPRPAGLHRNNPRKDCADLREHRAHARCLGIQDDPCSMKLTHGPHWPAPGVRCRGLGLAGICTHGNQILNQCRECLPDQEESRNLA